MITWDIISAEKIDWLKFPLAATSVDFHPEGLYIATTHVGSIGVCLWVNKMRFGIAGMQQAKEPVSVSLPLTGEVTIESELDNTDAIVVQPKLKRTRADAELEEALPEAKKPKIMPDMISLSGLPKHIWQTIPALDSIRVRNNCAISQFI